MKFVLIKFIKFYQFFLSPWIGKSCRFEPSCSNYAIEAINQYGSIKGCYLTIRRLLRCHPFCDGGYDPVPGTNPARNPCDKG